MHTDTAENLVRHFAELAKENPEWHGNLNRIPLIGAMHAFGKPVNDQHIDYWMRNERVPELTQIAASLASGRTIKTNIGWFEKAIAKMKRDIRKQAKEEIARKAK